MLAISGSGIEPRAADCVLQRGVDPVSGRDCRFADGNAARLALRLQYSPTLPSTPGTTNKNC